MTRAFLYGLVVLVTLDALGLASLIFWTSPTIFVVTSYGGPFLASLITARSAPHDRIFLGIMIALPAALLAPTFNAAYEAMGGRVDAVGLTGGIVLFFLSLSFLVLVCSGGAVSGGLLAARRSGIGRARPARFG